MRLTGLAGFWLRKHGSGHLLKRILAPHSEAKMQHLSMDQALSIILNTFKRGAELDAHALAVMVLDGGGRVKAFLKQDGRCASRWHAAKPSPP